MTDLNKPSFFRAGGLPMLGADQRLTAGKAQDGSLYIDISGKHNARAYMRPQQWFELAVGMLETIGYRMELKGPEQ